MGFNGITKDLIEYHKAQLIKSAVPELFWENIFAKLQNQIYDAGEVFQVNQIIEDQSISWEVTIIKPDGVKHDDPNNVFLIDHAWTYEAKYAREQLQNHDGLAIRMAKLMDITNTEDGANSEDLIDSILDAMWKYNNTYSVASTKAEEQLPIWYIMDEFGSKIQHCGEPNVRVVPFYYHLHKCCYSILFPIQDIEVGEEITRNYVESPPVDDVTRDAQMLPWFYEDMTAVDYSQLEPPIEFLKSMTMQETEPDDSIEVIPLNLKEKIKVFTDNELVKTHLTDNRFEITENQDDAHVIWISSHFKDFKKLRETPEKRINQFPMENLLTVKDLLAVVCRRVKSEKIETEQNGLNPSGPSWLPTTFCLNRELPKFVSYYQNREKLNLDNHWIIKPWNLARGLDLTVTKNLNHILRLPSTGPKVAQKYIENPVLFKRDDINAYVKFDLRYIVLLLSVKPLKVAIYDRFWIRFGNKAFALDNLDDYEQHFTVNNYNDKYLLQMYCHKFIEQFESQYPNESWENVKSDIYAMIKEMFIGATKYDTPRGIGNNQQCRGSYGLDIMIKWDKNSKGENKIVPQLLEVNFNADCKRACEYYPEFFNDLFDVMFLNEVQDKNVTILE